MVNKKHVVIVIIILLIIAGFFVWYSQNQIKVGNMYVAAPEGYHASTNEKGIVNLTNGYDSWILNEYSNNSTDLNYSINYYKQVQKNKNLSVQVKNFTVNNVVVYKTIVNNGTDIYHYWFLNGGKIYEFTTFDGNSNSDQFVGTLIKSMKNSVV